MPDHSVAKGDLIKLDYDVWAETGGKSEIVDTTSREVAHEAKWEGRKDDEFGAVPYEVGRGKFPKLIEEALESAKVGETIEKELSPAEAYGDRDGKLIELFSIREVSRLPEMRRDDAKLDIGTTLTINGRRGRVLNVTPGRVRVDFNDPLAGKKIRAKLTVKEKISTVAEKVEAIVEMEYGRSKEFSVEHKGDILHLKVPDKAKFDINWHAAKSGVVERIRTHVKPTTIQIIEEYKTPTKKEEAESKAEPKGEAKAESA